ncbi:MAG: L,D-transpeptidase [Gammaproteobacteria bacterium]|nr:L,D-transpeptidase [Gammaproteobacteria bacterium]
MSEKQSLRISIAEQQLYLQDASGRVIKQYPVSTSQYGTGNREGSFMTPLGQHCIHQKIGTGAARNEVFVGRVPMGVLDELQAAHEPLPEDIITSRILWLRGLEPGINQGGDVDSFQRYIYIHGTNEEDSIGTPASHGCIRMRNEDVIELYDAVDVDCLVTIEE